ncbi:hypothetical protein CYMTET_29782, partial [Cymbomonas tetramitiformis]
MFDPASSQSGEKEGSVLSHILGDDDPHDFDDTDWEEDIPRVNRNRTGVPLDEAFPAETGHTPAGEDRPAYSKQHEERTSTELTQQEVQAAGTRVEGTPVKPRKPCAKKYFILKSLNHQNIASAIEHQVWATQRRNEAKLNEAFFSAEKVYLIFSVNMSHHFQGYARMFSPIGYGDKPDWCGDVGVGGSFKIRWQSLYDLPFRETGHLTNPLNENKVVKISRDGQEMAEEVGDKLVALIEEGSLALGRPPPHGREESPPPYSRDPPSAPPAAAGKAGKGSGGGKKGGSSGKSGAEDPWMGGGIGKGGAEDPWMGGGGRGRGAYHDGGRGAAGGWAPYWGGEYYGGGGKGGYGGWGPGPAYGMEPGYGGMDWGHYPPVIYGAPGMGMGWEGAGMGMRGYPAEFMGRSGGKGRPSGGKGLGGKGAPEWGGGMEIAGGPQTWPPMRERRSMGNDIEHRRRPAQEEEEEEEEGKAEEEMLEGRHRGAQVRHRACGVPGPGVRCSRAGVRRGGIVRAVCPGRGAQGRH